MRRPLTMCCAFFTAILYVLLQIQPLWWSKNQALPEYQATLQGVIVGKEYKVSKEQFVLVLELDECILLPGLESISCKLLCYLDQKCDTIGELVSFEEKLGQKIGLGNTIVLQGKISNFASATNPGQFDAKQYYQILGIGGSVYACRVLRGDPNSCLGETTDEDSSKSRGAAGASGGAAGASGGAAGASGGAQVSLWWWLKETLYQKKRYASLLFYSVLPKEDASLMCSLLLGEKSLLDQEIKSLYQQSGIIHILAISGLHISLFGMTIFKLLRKIQCPFQVSGSLAFGVVFLYGLVVGMGPSSARAVLMFSLQMCAFLLGRTYDMLTGLSLAAFWLLISQPLYLFHSGFLLSFGAVLSMALIVPGLQDLFPAKATSGMAILFGTFPIQAVFYYQIAPYSLLLNLLVIPLVGVLLVCGILIQVFGLFSLSGAKVFGTFGGWLLALFSGAGGFTLALPGKQWIVGKPSAYQVFLYLTILVIVLTIGKKMPKVWCYLCLCIGIGALVRNWQTGMQITCLDVGQGDGIYVTDHRNHHVLIDGGSSTAKGVGGYRILPFLKSQGCGHLDGIFISHLDEDHYNGVLELMELSDEEGIPIGCIYLSTDDGGEKREEISVLAQAHGIAVKEIKAGDVFRKGDIVLECIYPGEKSVDGNENSMTMLLNYGDFSGLFTGDLEGVGEYLVATELEKHLANDGVTLLKVAHHGSKNSTGDRLLQVIQPKIAVISSSPEGRYGHPHQETIDRLEKWGINILRTDERGAVTLFIRRGKIWVRSFLEEQ